MHYFLKNESPKNINKTIGVEIANKIVKLDE